MGPVKNAEYESFAPARWYEKIATVTLILGILAIGLAPLWLSDMIGNSLDLISRSMP
jgi:NADH-quinone oxidoreductase subunit M